MDTVAPSGGYGRRIVHTTTQFERLMASDWFCKISDEKYGPLSPKQLKGMAAKGEIAPDDWVKQGADGSWVAASQIKGLFDATEPPDTRAKPLPVARAAPIPPTTPVAASAQTSSAPPVAKAVPVAAAAPTGPSDAFKITTDADQPASGSPSHSGSKYLDAKSRKKKQDKVVTGLIVLVIGIAVVGIVLMIWGNPFNKEASETETETPTAEEPVEDFSADEPSEDEPSDEAPSDQSKPTTSVPVDKPKDTHANTPADKWVDASKGTYYLAPLSVRIDSVKVLKPEMRKVDQDGKVVITRSNTECLIITLELTNTQAEKAVKCTGWAKRANKPSLTDDMKNSYPAIGIPKGRTIAGQASGDTIPAGESVTDVAIFKKPADDIEYLELKLPASAFRRSGSLRFKIPADMIVTVEEGGEAPDQPDPFKEVDEKE